MDIKYVNNDYQFLYRTSAIIFNKNKTKVLLFNVEGRKFYMIPGGKVNQKEESIDAIKREIKEELGYTNIDFSFLAITEEFVFDKGFYNQQINLIYKGILKDDIKETKFKGLEGNWINFEWIDISNIDNYEIYPNQIKEAIKNPKKNISLCRKSYKTKLLRGVFMFKIAKLEEVNNEKLNIDYITQEEYKYENGKSNLYDSFKTLSFNISGEDYSFSFDLNCKPEKLLEIPFSETIDFNKYIIQGETWLNIKNSNGIEPEIDIKITRYLKNKFAIYIKFYTSLSYDDNDYSGVIEFSFNLNDYLNI